MEPCVIYSFLFMFGVMSLILKSYRFIYIIISLEICIISLVISLMSTVSESLFFLQLGISLVSSILGLLMIVMMLVSYGSDHVKF